MLVFASSPKASLMTTDELYEIWRCNLKVAFDRRGFTKNQIAKIFLPLDESIYSYLNGNVRPSPEKLLAIMNEFGIPPHEVFNIPVVVVNVDISYAEKFIKDRIFNTR